MAVTVIRGNLLEADVDIIGHQVNCKGVMGAGIALQLRRKYSGLFDHYIEYLATTPRPLGTVSLYVEQGKPIVANLYGQYGYGRYGVHTDYDALGSALWELSRIADIHGMSVALPYGIGCGLAGGDWNIVLPMIEDIFQDVDCFLYKL